MTRPQLAVLLMVCAGICLAAMFFLPWSSKGQDVPPCVDADAFVAELAKDGALEGPSVEYESRHSDKLRLVEFQGILWALLTNRGCLIVKPIPLDYAKDHGEPA